MCPKENEDPKPIETAPPAPPADPKQKDTPISIMEPNDQEKEKLTQKDKDKSGAEIKDLQKSIEQLPTAIAAALNPKAPPATSTPPASSSQVKTFLDDLADW